MQAASQSSEDLKAADLVREQLLEGELDIQRRRESTSFDGLGKGFSVVAEIFWDGVR